MGAFLSYSIISGLLMLAMYLAYRLFMARENQHGYNRGVLLLIYFISFTALPAIDAFDAMTSAASSIDTVETVEGVVMAATFSGDSPVWGSVLIWIYMCGAALVIVKTLLTWMRIIRIIYSGENIRCGSYTLVIISDHRFAPFTWMRFIVLNRKDYEENYDVIMTHELKHVTCHHWIDLLVAQLVCVVNWFNPAAWLMREELMLVHEYQADVAVLESGCDPRNYQLLLIKKAVGARFPSLANSLNHSKLKKRITMMYKEKSGAGQKFRALALVPMLALAIGVSTAPVVCAAVSTISSSNVSVGKVNENLPQDKAVESYFKVTNLNNKGNSTTVIVKGYGLGDNLTVSGGTFTTMGKTYQAKSLKCNMTDGKATITAEFPFSTEFENTSMTLMVNGKETTFDIEAFLQKANPLTIVADNGAVVKASCEDGSGVDGLVCYLDGKKIAEAELIKIPSDDIASITVDRQRKVMIITSVKR